MIILVVFIVFVISIVVLIELRERKRIADSNTKDETIANTQSVDPNCCGAHLVCERDLLTNPITEIVYYDDQELDDYKNIASDAYSEDEIKQFSEIFYTLQDSDVSGWLRSLQARNINLPDQLKDEALMIVREQRAKQSNDNNQSK